MSNPSHLVRAENRSRILKALMDQAVSSRPELARRLGLSLMALTRITRELIDAGLVDEGERYASLSPGRPATGLAAAPRGAYVLGFEVHAFRQSVVMMDLARRVVSRKILKAINPGDGARCMTEFGHEAKRCIERVAIDPRRVMGAGVAVTGTVDHKSGILVDAPYLGWTSLDIAAHLQGLGIPIAVDRIANTLLAAEAGGGAEPLHDAMLFNVGFGMSAAFLVGGKLAYGARSAAGHVGAMDGDDVRMAGASGQKNSLNSAASGWATLSALGEIEDEVASAEAFQRHRGKLADLLGRERQGAPAACDAMRRVGEVLGRAIRRLTIALDPARMFLSGPVGRAASFVEGVRRGVGPDFAELVVACERQVADAAALMALEEFVRSPQMDFDRLRKGRVVR